MTALVLGSAAVADLEEIHGHIHGHYESVEDGLGSRFVEALDELFRRLEEFPRSAPLVAGYVDVRRAVVRGCPYVVFYRHRPERIDVLRVWHAAREEADRPRTQGCEAIQGAVVRGRIELPTPRFSVACSTN